MERSIMTQHNTTITKLDSIDLNKIVNLKLGDKNDQSNLDLTKNILRFNTHWNRNEEKKRPRVVYLFLSNVTETKTSREISTTTTRFRELQRASAKNEQRKENLY
ncbi:hypothetical protein H5410_012784 [Solanum commersonii]|uniref:Uncharacterized protein n=1 Tax=Solanum commersonii TaxID=4109 RepID=A0A9J6ASM8_SOLCO|nr:hypothetical protein H5410_012784 [Solanum commersonii]